MTTQGDRYKTIETRSEGLFKEKGSKFLAFAHPVETVEAVKELLEGYRKIYYDARHVCYAYSLGTESPETRANDDGEPSGTAGRPILGQIQSAGLTNVLVVVVRYFGGVLLGTGGLVQAYKAAAADALSQASVVERTIDVTLGLSFEYPFLDVVLRVVRQWEGRVLSQSWESDCLMTVSVRKGSLDALYAALEKVETLRFDN
jgi:uncharacterized YigZ family protein